MVQPKHRFLRRQVLMLCVFMTLSIVFTWPLALDFDGTVLGWPGDNLEYVWKMWWFEHAILDLQTSPFFAPQVYHPYGLDMAHAEMTPANTVLGIPVTALLGPVVSYNVMVFASFVLSGLGMYLLASEYVQHEVPALASGIVFAFSPYRVAHSAGHLPLMGTQWIPLTFWALERWRKTGAWQWGMLGGLFFAFLALSSWYYAVFAAIALVVYAVLCFRPWRRAFWSRRTVGGILVFVSVVGVLVTPFGLPYVRLLSRGEMEHDFAALLAGSAEVTDFIVPNLLHPLWGKALQNVFPSQARLWVERSIYVGIVALLLSGVALIARRQRMTVQTYAGLAVVAGVLALGPILRWAGTDVTVAIPGWLRDMFVRSGLWPLLVQRLGASDGSLAVPLPVQVLRILVPGASAIRVWSRMGVFAVFSVANLAGIGLDVLLERFRSGQSVLARSAISYGTIALLLFDFLAIPSLWPVSHPAVTSTQPRPVDLWLAQQQDGALAEFPISLGGPEMFHSIAHGKAIVQGYGTFFPAHFLEKKPLLAAFPSKDTIALLREWNVRYVLVQSERYGGEWDRVRAELEQTESLALAYSDQSIYVYRLDG